MGINKAKIGERIRALRIAHGLSQKQLGDALGVSISTISSYEKGRVIPKYSFLAKMCDYLKIPKSKLINLNDYEINDKNRIYYIVSNYPNLSEENKQLLYFITEGLVKGKDFKEYYKNKVKDKS